MDPASLALPCSKRLSVQQGFLIISLPASAPSQLARFSVRRKQKSCNRFAVGITYRPALSLSLNTFAGMRLCDVRGQRLRQLSESHWSNGESGQRPFLSDAQLVKGPLSC